MKLLNNVTNYSTYLMWQGEEKILLNIKINILPEYFTKA